MDESNIISSEFVNCFLSKVTENVLNEHHNQRSVEHVTEACIEQIAKHKFPGIFWSSPSHEETTTNLTKKFDKSAEINPTDDDLWIFGYGSLVWKADFPYIAREPGYICGYVRRFYQNSIDHRGTPSRPGRVVTLIPSKDPDSKVYGMGYRIASIQKDEVLRHLDYREKNGYERCIVNFTPLHNKNDDHISVTMYIATKDNESYAGHIANLDDIAEQIFWAVGPSGPNREYVYNLVSAMKNTFSGMHDDHLMELEAKLRQKEDEQKKLANNVKDEIWKIIYAHSTNSAIEPSAKVQKIKEELSTLQTKYSNWNKL